MENNRNYNVIRFYLIANRLKEKIRTGWIEIKISKERLESVAEHIYGCLILAIGLDSEYNLNLEKFINELGSFNYYSDGKIYPMRFINEKEILKTLKAIKKRGI